YLVIAAILTLMIPYNELSPDVALPEAFSYQGFPLGKYFVAVGGIFAMTTSLLTYLFSGSRIMYAMAHDGLLFEFFGSVNSKTQAPVRAVFFCGLTAATVALFVDTNKLVEMLSIGTMLAYTMVAISVILDRYKPPEELDCEGFTIKVPILKKVDGNANAGDANTNAEDIQPSWCDMMRACWRRRVTKTIYSTLQSDDINNPEVSPQPPLPDSQTYGTACLACAWYAIYFTFGFRNSKEGKKDDEIKKFLLKYSPSLSARSSEDITPQSSSTSSDDEWLSSMIATSEEERSPVKKRPK
ncbi:hypothetical protein QZH41_010546, partial [Actinostola sp. cb2023]